MCAFTLHGVGLLDDLVTALKCDLLDLGFDGRAASAVALELVDVFVLHGVCGGQTGPLTTPRLHSGGFTPGVLLQDDEFFTKTHHTVTR